MAERIPVTNGDRFRLTGHREDGSENNIELVAIEELGEIWLYWDYAAVYYVPAGGIVPEDVAQAFHMESLVKE